MSLKYRDRLTIPTKGFEDIIFFTKTGLEIAKGYIRIDLEDKPLIVFSENQIEKEKSLG